MRQLRGRTQFLCHESRLAKLHPAWDVVYNANQNARAEELALQIPRRVASLPLGFDFQPIGRAFLLASRKDDSATRAFSLGPPAEGSEVLERRARDRL